MNKKQAKEIEKATSIIADAIRMMTEAASNLEEIRDEISTQYEGMSEKSQEGDRGQELSEEISNLDEIIDAVGSVDFSKEIGEACSNLGFEIEGLPKAQITQEQLSDKRMSRLPQWAREKIERAAEGQKSAEQKVLENFTDPTGDPLEFTVWEHSVGKLAGKVIPAKTIEAKVAGLRLEVTRMPRDPNEEESWGVTIHAQRNLTVHPGASNVVTITGKKW